MLDLIENGELRVERETPPVSPSQRGIKRDHPVSEIHCHPSTEGNKSASRMLAFPVIGV